MSAPLPHPKPKKQPPSTLQKLATALDEHLLDVCRRGSPVFDKDGSRVVDSDGSPLFAPPTAAILSVACQRLKNCGVRSTVPEQTRDVWAEAIAQMRERLGEQSDSLKFPSLDNTEVSDGPPIEG